MTRRTRIAATLPVIAAVGLAGHALPGATGDGIGGVAYTALAYGLIAVLWPGLPPRRVAAAAFLFSSAIELLQLAGLAAELVDLWSPLRLLVGQSFVATDFIAYAAGAALAYAADEAAAARVDGSRSMAAADEE